jgi:hypothetical protein
MKVLGPAASILLAAACLSVSGRARAEPDAAAQAQVLFDEGLALLAKPKAPGDTHAYDDAIAKFVAAYRISPRPNALFNAALTEEKIGRPADAIRHFRELSHNPACTADLRSQIEKHVADLSPKVAIILLDAPAGADIAIDGVPTGERAPLPDPIDLSPGRHTIEAKLGVSASIEIDAVAGTRQTLRIGLVAPPSSAAGGGQPAQAATPPLAGAVPGAASTEASVVSGPVTDSTPSQTPFWTLRRTVGVVVAGAGVASLVASGVLQSASSHQRDQAASLRSTLGPSSCYGPSPSATCASLNDAFAAQDRDEDLSRVFLVSGVAGVALGAVIVLWPQALPTRTAIVPFPVRQGAGLQLQGEL